MPSRRRRRGRGRFGPASRRRARDAWRRPLAAGVAAIATLATALARSSGAGAIGAGPAGAAGPVSESGDGGALALWIVAEVIVLVVGVVALRVWTDHRPRRRGDPR